VAGDEHSASVHSALGTQNIPAVIFFFSQLSMPRISARLRETMTEQGASEMYSAEQTSTV
jgi:hypothetical protein